MGRLFFCCILWAAAAHPVLAQSGREVPPRTKELREKIEERFAGRVVEELELTPGQAARLKDVARDYGGRRRDLRQRERDLRGALEAQLDSVGAADQDSVAKLTRDILDLRVAYAESWREEMGKLSGFLDAGQRARLLVMRERLIQRVHELRDHRRGYRRRGDAH